MRKFTLLFVAVSYIFIGCSKESSDSFIPYAGNPANDTSWSANPTATAASTKLFEGLAYAPFIDSFDVSGSALLKVNANLDVAIPAACVTHLDGTPIPPSGKVRVEIRHVSKSGDFIRYARPTTTYGKLMESASAFQVKFYKQDQELAFLPGKKLFFTLKDPNPVNNEMVYFGNMAPQVPFPIGTNPFFTWMPAVDSSFITPFVRQDTAGVVTKGYQLFAGKINWINAQLFIDSTLAKTNITVTLPPNFTNNNTALFAVVKQQKIVVQLNGDLASRSFFAPNIPVGSPMVLVSLSLIGNQYYLGFKEITATQNIIAIVNPAARTKSEINTFLDGL